MLLNHNNHHHNNTNLFITLFTFSLKLDENNPVEKENFLVQHIAKSSPYGMKKERRKGGKIHLFSPFVFGLKIYITFFKDLPLENGNKSSDFLFKKKKSALLPPLT